MVLFSSPFEALNRRLRQPFLVCAARIAALVAGTLTDLRKITTVQLFVLYDGMNRDLVFKPESQLPRPYSTCSNQRISVSARGSMICVPALIRAIPLVVSTWGSALKSLVAPKARSCLGRTIQSRLPNFHFAGGPSPFLSSSPPYRDDVSTDLISQRFPVQADT